MSNNKQSMKLYTEEQVMATWNAAFMEGMSIDSEIYEPVFFEDHLNTLTPIQLPSDSLCINCDESESTHNICMDCMIKIGKENIQLPSDEEIEKQNPFVWGSHIFGTRDLLIWEQGAKWMRDKIQGGNK